MQTECHEPDRRPRALRYRDKLQAVEDMIVDALPQIAGKLIEMANDGDKAAARYLLDRMYGRPAKSPLPPSIDRTLPYDHHEWATAQLIAKDRRDTICARYVPALRPGGTLDELRKSNRH